MSKDTDTSKRFTDEGELGSEIITQAVEDFFNSYEANQKTINVLISRIDNYENLGKLVDASEKENQKSIKLMIGLYVSSGVLGVRLFIDWVLHEYALKSDWNLATQTVLITTLFGLALIPTFKFLNKREAKKLVKSERYKNTEERRFEPEEPNESLRIEYQTRLDLWDTRQVLIDFIYQSFGYTIKSDDISSFDQVFQLLKDKSELARKEFEKQKALKAITTADEMRRSRLSDAGFKTAPITSKISLDDLLSGQEPQSDRLSDE